MSFAYSNLLNLLGRNWGFEGSFKLTAEYLAVIGGVDSNLFKYFELLMIRGFLEIRAHAHDLILLVQMLSKYTYLPAFQRYADGQFAIDQLKQRFLLNSSEDVCQTHIKSIIMDAVNNWRAQQYDSFQYLVNGIL